MSSALRFTEFKAVQDSGSCRNRLGIFPGNNLRVLLALTVTESTNARQGYKPRPAIEGFWGRVGFHTTLTDTEHPSEVSEKLHSGHMTDFIADNVDESVVVVGAKLMAERSDRNTSQEFSGIWIPRAL